MKKNKIYNTRIFFYILVFMCIEIVTEISSTFAFYITERTMPAFGDPGKYVKLTLMGVIICIVVLLMYIGLVILPMIWITIKIRYNKMKKSKIYFLWGIALFAFALGVFLADGRFTFLSKWAYVLAQTLNKNLVFFTAI